MIDALWLTDQNLKIRWHQLLIIQGQIHFILPIETVPEVQLTLNTTEAVSLIVAIE